MAAIIFLHPFHYLFRYKRNIEELRYELRDINIMANQVRLSIYKAVKDTENNSDSFDGENWLHSVSDIINKADGVLEDYTIEVEKGCPNLIYRCLLSRKAEKMAHDIAVLQGIADTYLTQDSAGPSTEMPSTEAIMTALLVDRVNVIGLCGLGGTGKTREVTNVCKRALEKRLFDEILMVNVSHDLDVIKIQREVASVLGMELGDTTVTDRGLRLSQRLNSGRKTLIVLDDVSRPFDLQEVGIPVGDKCQVILTSRAKEVCSQMGSEKNFDMRAPGIWDSFRSSAGKWVDKAGLHSIAKEIVEDCGADFEDLAREVETRIAKIKKLTGSSLGVAVNEHRVNILI